MIGVAIGSQPPFKDSYSHADLERLFKALGTVIDGRRDRGTVWQQTDRMLLSGREEEDASILEEP